MTARQLQRCFESLLLEHRRIVFKVAGLYSRSVADCDDLVQEISTQLWRSFGGYDEARAKFSTWMYRIALNVAISHARGAGLRERHVIALDEDAHEIADDSVLPHETNARLRELHRCIDALGPFDRALMLLYLEERSHADIAEVLGITATNVATRINRLKQRIRAGLSENGQ